jgi:hypothetical protein
MLMHGEVILGVSQLAAHCRLTGVFHPAAGIAPRLRKAAWASPDDTKAP